MHVYHPWILCIAPVYHTLYIPPCVPHLCITHVYHTLCIPHSIRGPQPLTVLLSPPVLPPLQSGAARLVLKVLLYTPL